MTQNAEQIKKLVASLGDSPDPLHLDNSPAVQALAGFGIEVIPHLAAPLRAPDLVTRLQAQGALAEAISHHFGHVPGRGWSRPEGEAESQALWAKNGAYDANAPATAREQSIAAWLDWYQAQQPPRSR